MRTFLVSSSAVGCAVLRPVFRLIRAAILPMFVMSCGGGGGSGDAGDPGSVPATVTTIIVSVADAGIAVGQTRSVTAEARDRSGAAMTGVAFTWASSNSAVASVAGVSRPGFPPVLPASPRRAAA